MGFSDHVTIKFSVAIASDTESCVVELPITIRKYQWADADYQAMTSLTAYLSSID